MFSNWARRLFGRSKVARKRMQSARRSTLFQPKLESLEGRAMMAFIAPVSFPAGSNPAGIAVGDYNGDGRDDMAVVNTAVAGNVSVMLSNSDGTFQPGVSYSTGGNPLDATAGDFNGDGKVDLAVVGSAVDILLGNGDGTFGGPLEFAAAPSAHSVKVGDFNNDGKLDVGVMNVNSASVLLGNGDGTLQPHVDTAASGNNINLVVGDFNRDGNLDMATSVTNSIGTVSVLRGHGDGSFEPLSSYYAFSAPVYLATGDFNHDGYLDFACPNSYAATSMSVLLNNGDGTYAPPHTYGIAQTGYEIEVADFNNDGNDDFAVRGGSQYMISHGKGDGTFYPSVNFSTPAGRFEAGTHGDFNGDGAVDLAYPSTNGVTVVTNDNADAQSLAGAVTFRVEAPATTTSGSVLPMSISAVDANGNVATGFRGVVYLSSSDPLASTASGYAFNPLDAGIPYVFTAADAGSHAFTGAIRLVTGGDQTVKVSAPNMSPTTVTVNVTGQVTRLGISAPANVAAGDSFNITVSAIDSQGAVASAYSSRIQFTSTDALAGLPADYTFTPEDGGQHTFSVTLKSSGSRFVSAKEVGGSIGGGAIVNVTPLAATSLSLAGGAGAIGVARPLTIVARDTFGNVATGYSGTVHVTSSDAAAVLPGDVTLVNGAVTTTVTFLTIGTQTVTATDIVTPSITGTVSSDATPPIPDLFTVEDYPATTAGESHSFTVTVRDTIGQVASGYSGTVYFASTDGQADLPTSYTFTAADAGVHTFTATLKTAGLQSIQVSDTTGALTGTEDGIVVNAASFSKFQLSVPNGADSKGHMLVTAGETISLTVKPTDIYGNAVASYAGTVHLTSTDALAGLPSDYTFVAADSGSHTFSIYLGTATVNGVVWSFDVVDVANPATQVTMTNFEVINGVATNYVVALPTKIDAGVEFTSKVTVRDAFGNTVKNYFGTVHFSSSATNAALPADYTFNSVDAGVHDFTLAMNTSGSQTLTVADTADSSVTGSGNSSVNPAAASSIEVSSPSTAIAGAAQTVTVRVLDAYGNVASGYRGTVSFASSDAQAVLPASYVFATKDNGVHTFSVTLKTAGTQSIRVADSTTASIAGSQTGINVTASAAAGSFVVTGFPATTAGVAQTFTVKAKDTFGNFTSSYLGTVTFSSSDVQAGLPASYTFTAADGGVRTFTATLKTAGLQSITVKDSVTSTAVGSQSLISVTSANAVSFSVTGYPTTTAGTSQSFTVTAKDVYGNRAIGYTGTVQFGSSDVKAGLPANYTFTLADAGAHTFSAVLKSAGTQSLSAFDMSSATILGSQTGIAVSSAAAATFSISAPTTATQGVGFNFTVTVLDAYGNVVTGYRGKIQIGSSDPKAGSSSYSFSSKDNGVATLSYKFSTLGSQTLTVTDTANASVIGRATLNVVSKK